MQNKTLKTAFEFLDDAILWAGGVKELAMKCGFVRTNFLHWRYNGRIMPHHALRIQEVTGGKVMAWQLCPKYAKLLQDNCARCTEFSDLLTLMYRGGDESPP